MTDTYVYVIHEADWDSDAYLPSADGEGLGSEQLEPMFPEHKAFQAAVERLGAKLVGGEALQSTKHGGTVVPGAGDRKVEDAVYTDGPFTDTSEVISGFYMVQTDDEAVARELAALVPTGGHIEWRKVLPIGG